MAGKITDRALDKTFNTSFPNQPTKSASFIVTSTIPFPTGMKGYCIEVLEDSTGVSITDELLLDGSGGYPDELLGGFRSYGAFRAISITAGSIKVYV